MRSDPASKGPLCLDSMTALEEKYQSEGEGAVFKQGLVLPPSSSPLGVTLGVHTDEGEGSGFSKRKVVQGSRGFSSWGLPKLKPHHPEQG